jgi:hypothetical protein
MVSLSDLSPVCKEYSQSYPQFDRFRINSFKNLTQRILSHCRLHVTFPPRGKGNWDNKSLVVYVMSMRHRHHRSTALTSQLLREIEKPGYLLGHRSDTVNYEVVDSYDALLNVVMK